MVNVDNAEISRSIREKVNGQQVPCKLTGKCKMEANR